MLRDKIEQFTKLTGRDGWHTPIGVIGAYLDGYERGLEETGPKGKWIGKPLAGRCTVRCSNCRHVFVENNGLWNFCPNCGAYMRGNENE